MKGLRGNVRIPTDAEIIENYAYEEEKDEAGVKVGWTYKPSHTAVLHIKVKWLKLYDVNNNDQVNWKNRSNQFVPQFYDAVDNFVLPRIANFFVMNIADVRRHYMIPRCYVPLAYVIFQN